jgi:hypothetical protein
MTLRSIFQIISSSSQSGPIASRPTYNMTRSNHSFTSRDFLPLRQINFTLKEESMAPSTLSAKPVLEIKGADPILKKIERSVLDPSHDILNGA